MKQKIKIVLLAMMVMALLIGCHADEGRGEDSGYAQIQFFDTFDTIVEAKVYAKDNETAQAITKMIQSEFERYHQLFTQFDPYEGVTNVYAMNHANGSAVKVNEELFTVLQKGKEWGEAFPNTNNMAMGKVLELWHAVRDQADDGHGHETHHAHEGEITLPTKAEIDNALAHQNLDDVILDPENQTVQLKDPEMAVDLGSIAKGYATEMVMKKATEMGMTSGIISAGGNVKAVGTPPGKEMWRVGVENPGIEGNKDAFIAVLGVTNQSIVTSGDYQRYVEIDGVRYHHLIDPKTGYPAQGYKAVVVVTPDATRADFLSTTLFVLPLEESQKAVASMDDVEAIWVLHDGQIIYSDGIKALLQ